MLPSPPLTVPDVQISWFPDYTVPAQPLGSSGIKQKFAIVSPLEVSCNRVFGRLSTCRRHFEVGGVLSPAVGHHAASPFRAAVGAFIQASISDSIHALRMPWRATALGKAFCAIRR